MTLRVHYWVDGQMEEVLVLEGSIYTKGEKDYIYI